MRFVSNCGKEIQMNVQYILKFKKTSFSTCFFYIYTIKQYKFVKNLKTFEDYSDLDKQDKERADRKQVE